MVFLYHSLNVNVYFADCRHLIKNSLILMGEIGGNDYNHAVIAGKPIDELKSYVPLVINTIVSAINVSINIKSYTTYINLTCVY